MINDVLSGISNLALRQKIRNDDGVDQLHHFVTVTILAFFAAIAGFKEFAGEPLNCWTYGDSVMKHYQDHVNSYCWTHNLYRYPNMSNLNTTPFPLDANGAREDQNLDENDIGKITFYRWVTVMFLLQAFLFKLPNLLWSEFNAYSGTNIVKMVEMLQDVIFAKEEDKKEKIRQVGLFLEQWLRIHRKRNWFLRTEISTFAKKTLSCCMLCIGNNISNYLSTLYLVMKALFWINNLLQFAIISAFLQLNFWDFGVITIRALSHPERRVATSPTFPVVALCHFQTYDKRRAIGFWVQCILNINMFLEKLFLIEWFWLLLLFVITTINFGHWCFKILQTRTAKKFVHRYMRLMEPYQTSTEVPVNCTEEQFILEYLRNDGIFVLRILAVNTNDVVVAQLVEELWLRYIKLKNCNFSMDIVDAETIFTNDDMKVRERVTAT